MELNSTKDIEKLAQELAELDTKRNKWMEDEEEQFEIEKMK